MTLTLHATGWTSSDYRAVDTSAQEVAFLDLSAWREAATLTTAAGAVFTIRRDDIDGALIVAGADGIPVAQATKPSIWESTYALEWPGGRGTLTRASMWRSSAFALSGEAGQPLMTLTQRGFWRSRIEVEAPAAWPIERVLFVAAIVAFVLRTEAAAAA